MKGTIIGSAALLLLLASPTPVPSADLGSSDCSGAAGCQAPVRLPYDIPLEVEPAAHPDQMRSGAQPRVEIVHWEELHDTVVTGGSPNNEPIPPRPTAGSAGSIEGLRVVVSLPQQKAYVFRAGELVDSAPVSTGKRGHETPVGTFPIMEKQVHHRSNKYSNAPMPYMQRLTSSGIALHAGHLPGYRASHGCIRLPWSFAKKLFGITRPGTPVTVTNQRIQDIT